MAIVHCLLNGSGSSGDGSTWADDSSGTAAFIAGAGLVSAISGAAAGDTVYVKGADTVDASHIFAAGETVSFLTNPVRVIGVKAATTNTGGSIVQSDLTPGIRTGQTTRAYAQTGANAPPSIIPGGSTADHTFRGGLYLYGIIFTPADNLTCGGGADNAGHFEECEVGVPGSGDVLRFGLESATAKNDVWKLTHSRINVANSSGIFRFRGFVRATFTDCEIDVISTGRIIDTTEFSGHVRFLTCDFSGSTGSANIVEVDLIDNGTFEFFNCTFPASHVLVTGTPAANYYVSNYGSEDNTGLGSTDSEQQLEIRTLQGTVDIETTVVRTGGATDLATGLFAYAVVANNVTDNFVGVEVPLRDIWVEGDGTAKTYKVHIANSTASTDFQDDEVSLRLSFPSEAGISRYDYLPDEGAPGDKGGLMQLLGTAADLTDDTGSTWGTGGNNHQTVENAIAMDYQGVIHGTLIYSRSGSDILYVDPLPVIT